jgi:hypothetical protein
MFPEIPEIWEYMKDTKINLDIVKQRQELKEWDEQQRDTLLRKHFMEVEEKRKLLWKKCEMLTGHNYPIMSDTFIRVCTNCGKLK